MYETLGLDMDPRTASIWFGVALGVAFGSLAQVTRFCLRRALIGPETERAEARGVWAMALVAAVIGTQLAVATGWISFSAHRFHAASVPIFGLVIGGLLFGVGTVLARGCLSRLTVLGASGNLRAIVAVLVAAIVAHATLQGVLAPVRSAFASVTVPLGTLPGAPLIWAGALGLVALVVALRSGARPILLVGAALLGALVAIGWVVTGFVLFDEFDPIALDSLAFSGPWAESLFFGVASSVTTPRFGVGLIGGVLVGALLAAVARGAFRWESYETPGQMGRSLIGGALMGFGGVLA
ncbi:MAG: YeeE/YedE family protein, partial [Octadecabacter sp.]|nr:YeeE/YedE family protein [Octadecabacter sp.]